MTLPDPISQRINAALGQQAGKHAAELNAAYRERAHLVALLAAQYPSHIGHTDPESPNWAVVTIQLPTGQACWHVAADDMDLFEHVRPTSPDDPGWDGHTTAEKYGRVDDLATQVAAARVADEQPQDERDGAVKLARRAPCDRISYVADQLEAAITDLRDLPGVSRARVVLAASVTSLRELADVVLGLEAAQDERDGDVRAVAALLDAREDGAALAELKHEFTALEARFAGRIAELDAREASAEAGR